MSKFMGLIEWKTLDKTGHTTTNNNTMGMPLNNTVWLVGLQPLFSVLIGGNPEGSKVLGVIRDVYNRPTGVLHPVSTLWAPKLPLLWVHSPQN